MDNIDISLTTKSRNRKVDAHGSNHSTPAPSRLRGAKDHSGNTIFSAAAYISKKGGDMMD